MSTDHPNAARLREAMESFNSGNIEEYAELLADDVVWHQIGAPTLHGKGELAASMPSAESGDSIEIKLHDVVANDEHGVALVEAHATRGGRTFDYRTTEIVHFRDGKVTERWAFAEDTQAIKDFFA